MKKLPIGIQNFKKLIKENYLYIDKTEYIYKLITTGDYYFLSRPRRFGKSLLISTLKEIFSGNEQLFEGLWIHDKVEWETYPVIHIDFSKLEYKNQSLYFAIDQIIDIIASQYDVSLKSNTIKSKFGELIEKLSNAKKVVVLIDEYDKPIIDYIDDLDQAEENRDILKNFYSIIKPSDPFLEFVFLTGVSKFSKVSVFSDLNNLRDITLSTNYSEMLGYTQNELEHFFAENIQHLHKELQLTTEKTLSMIREWYNGYSWDGEHFVYNPFSILNLFAELSFGNYWFATGTPTFLINHIRKNTISPEEFEKIQVLEYTFDKFELRNMDLISLLFQTGYLTIKNIEKLDRVFTLSYPNNEVKHSLLYSLFSDLTNGSTKVNDSHLIRLKRELRSKNINSFFTTLKSLFASIPYNIFIDKDEAYYHSVIYLILNLLGVTIDCEIQTNIGRIDATIEQEDTVFIMEFKIEDSEKALNQIKQRKYHEKYLNSGKQIILIGVGFSIEEKNIKDWKIEQFN